MRRLLPLVLAASCLTGAAAHALPLTYGVHGGISMPYLRRSDATELSQPYSTGLGGFAGGFVETPVSPTLSLRLELDYDSQGGRREGLQPIHDTTPFPVPPGTPLFADYTTEAQLGYLEFPLLLGWHFGTARQFELQGGPFGGVLLSARRVTSGTSLIYTDPQGKNVLQDGGTDYPAQDLTASTDEKSTLHDFNWGLMAGVTMAQSLYGGTLLLEARGALGLTDLEKDPAQGAHQTGGLVIAVGYAWGPKPE